MNILDRNNNIVLSTPFNEGAILHYDLMGEHYIRIVFNTATPVSLSVGDYISTEYGIFELLDTNQCTYNTNSGGYEYSVMFHAYYRKWGNKIVRYSPADTGSESGFSLTAPIGQHCTVITSNLSALGTEDEAFLYNFSDDFTCSFDSTVDTTVSKYINYENKSILDAISDIAEAFGCEWWVEGSVIHFGRCEKGTEVNMILGQSGENVESMSPSRADQNYATRIYAYGSERNLPPNYRASTHQTAVNGIVQRRLMLPADRCPNGYLQLGSVTNEVQAIEKVVIFDEEYPKVECEVGQVTTYESTVHNDDGSVTTKVYYRVTDVSGFDFSADMILDGETLHIRFETGRLAGMEFECHYNATGQYYEVVMNSDYGTELPNNILRPMTGDTFVLFGWDATMLEGTDLIEAAEDRLYELAAECLAGYAIDPNSYSVTAKTTLPMYGIGQRVKLVNKAYFQSGRSSRIIGVEFKLDIPNDHPQYIVGENAAYSRSGSLEEEIKELRIKGINNEYKNTSLAKYAHGFDYLKRALNESTSIEGGLILSSLIQLGYTNNLNERVTMSGMNGLYDTGKSIAFWAGGDMNDMEYPTAGGGSLAQYVMRMDGSGYMAGGNIKWSSDGSGSVANGAIQWDANGNITQFKNTSNTVISQFDSGIKIGSHTLLEADLVNISQIVNKVDNSFFNKLFTAIDANGNAIPVNGSATPVKIRANFDFFSVGESSAFGIDSSGGGGGGGLSPEGMWSLLGNNDSSKQINISHLTGALANYALSSSLATVATSGSYNDLSNKPTIPAAQIQSDWNQTTTTAKDYIKNKPSLATVATSGKYSDLTGVPTKVSQFTNDSNYVTSSSLTTTLASYATQTWVTNKGYATTSAMNTELAKYLPLTGGTMSNTNLVTNLNADLLDGVHASGLFTNLSNSGNNISLTIGGTTNTLQVGYADNANSASTATTLKNSRSIWGQSFNGSANVRDTLYMLSSTAEHFYSPSAKLKFNSADVDTDEIVRRSPYIQALGGLSYGRMRLSIFQSNATNYTDDFVEAFTVLPNGNVGVNTSAPTHKLHIEGTGYFSGLITASGNIKTASYIEIGDYRIVADTANTALKVVNKDGTTAVNFYATGENSALGVNTSGGGGGGDGASLEAVWTSLGSSTGTYGSSQINASHLTNALASYATQSWVEAKGYLTSYTETDPVFTASAAHGITSANITSWNNKVSNVQADWNATSGLAVILNKPTNLVTTSAMNTALNGYLPLAGGTLTGRLITRDVGSTWANGFSPNYSAITFPAIDDDQSYHPYLHGTSSDGSVWNLGGIQTRVGIYGYVADHEGNYTDWRTWWNTTNGYLTHSGGMEVGGQITSSVANGTAPLVIASSTLVSNLNADKLDGVDASGLFTALSNSGNNISVTIGGTNMTLQVGYATSAGTATTLANSRTIWGQNFNGSTNVSGNMTGVGSLDASGDITVTRSSTTSAIMKVVNENGAVSLLASVNRGVYDSETSKWVIGTNGTNTFLMDGNVGIGTTSPTYKLHVDGTVYATSLYLNGGNYFGSNSTQLYAYIGTANPFVLGSDYIRRGTSDTDVTLGTSSYRWANLYSVLGNFSGQITSSVATGTSPLSVASTTLNENLNADLLDGHHATELARLGWKVFSPWNSSSGTNCRWREIDAPSTSTHRVVYDIVSFRYGWPFISYYRLTLFSYGTVSINVSLVNLGMAQRIIGQSRICVGVATNGKVYIQSGSTGANNFLYVRNILSTDAVSAGTIHTESVGEAAFGTANGFTAAKIITDSGYCRVNRSTGEVETSGDPSIITSLRIGDACFWWDETNNCLRITGANANGVQSTSVAVNVNVSGEVSALKTS